MGATLPKLTFILAATLCGCIPPAQAAIRDPETLLTGPMDPTVDGDLCLGEAQPDRQAMPTAMLRWTENHCGPDAGANGPWPTFPDDQTCDRLPGAATPHHLENNLGTR